MTTPDRQKQKLIYGSIFGVASGMGISYEAFKGLESLHLMSNVGWEPIVATGLVYGSLLAHAALKAPRNKDTEVIQGGWRNTAIASAIVPGLALGFLVNRGIELPFDPFYFTSSAIQVLAILSVPAIVLSFAPRVPKKTSVKA